MGYYTYHILNVRGIKGEEEFESLKHAMSGKEEGIGQIIGYALDCGYYCDDGRAVFGCNDSAKWYDHDDDMLALSKKFPDMTFQISGDGEERDDIWESYYKNGEHEECRVEIHMPEPTRIRWE